MMFSFRDFIKRGFLNAIGKLADYQIILNAAGWYDKGVLLEEDLAEIQSALSVRDAATTPATDAPSEGDTSANDPPSEGDTPANDAPSEGDTSANDAPSEDNTPANA